MDRCFSVALGLVLLATGCAGGTPSPAAPAAPAGGDGLYSGGDGLSCESAVVVHASDTLAGVQAEYAWVRAHYPGYQKGGQALTECGDKPADRLDIRTADGKEVSLYFDISNFFGKL